MAVRTAIVDGELDTAGLIKWAKTPKAGAIVFFGGTTRDNCDDKTVVSLAYEAYIPRAEKTLREIALKASEMPGVHNVAIEHRIGTVPVCEESVAIVVATSHRHQGWEAAKDVLEKVKESLEIWKREVFDDGRSQWVEGVARKG